MADDKEKEIAALRAKYGEEIAVYYTSLGVLVFKAPGQDEYEDFFDSASAAASDKNRKAAAMRSLCLRCALEPSRDRLVEIFKKRPGLPGGISARLVEMANEDVEDVAKKG